MGPKRTKRTTAARKPAVESDTHVIPITIPVEHPPNAIVLEPRPNTTKGAEPFRYHCTDCGFNRLSSNFNKVAEHGLLKHDKLFVKNPFATAYQRATATAPVTAKKQKLEDVKAVLMQQASAPEQVSSYFSWPRRRRPAQDHNLLYSPKLKLSLSWLKSK